MSDELPRKPRKEVERAALDGTINNWSIDKVHGLSVLRGTVMRPNPLDGKPPLTAEVAMRLIWWSHDVFGCHDGLDSFAAPTHTFKQGTGAIDTLPYLARLT